MKQIELKNIHVIGRQVFPDRAFNWQKNIDWFNITFEFEKSKFQMVDDFLQSEVSVNAKPNYHTFDLILKKYWRGK